MEGEFERYDERIVDLCKYGPFGESVRDFRSRDNVCLTNGLEGVDAAGIFLPVDLLVHGILIFRCKRHEHLHNLHDLSETTLTNDLQQVEVLQLHAAVLVFDKRYADSD